MLNCLCSPSKAPFFVLSVILTLLYPAGAHGDTPHTIGTDEVGTVFIRLRWLPQLEDYALQSSHLPFR